MLVCIVDFAALSMVLGVFTARNVVIVLMISADKKSHATILLNIAVIAVQS